MVPTELDMSTFEELKQMSGSDFIDELVDTFLEDAPKLLAELRSSLAARDAEVIPARRPFSQVERRDLRGEPSVRSCEGVGAAR